MSGFESAYPPSHTSRIGEVPSWSGSAISPNTRAPVPRPRLELPLKLPRSSSPSAADAPPKAAGPGSEPVLFPTSWHFSCGLCRGGPCNLHCQAWEEKCGRGGKVQRGRVRCRDITPWREALPLGLFSQATICESQQKSSFSSSFAGNGRLFIFLQWTATCSCAASAEAVPAE